MSNFSPSQKMAMVFKFLSGEATVAELCRIHGIRSTKTIYNWRDQVRNGAEIIFAEKRGRPGRHPAKLPPPGFVREEDGVTSDAAVDDLDAPDKALQDLFGIDEADLARRASRALKPRNESRRGRTSLKRLAAFSALKRQSKQAVQP